MDQGSAQGSEGTAPWSPMGGNIGEGGFQAANPLPGSGAGLASPGPPYSNSGFPQQQPQTPYQQQQAHPGGAFAAPPPSAAPPAPPGSFAARSAQAHAQFNAGQPAVSVSSVPAPQQQPPASMANQQPQAGSYAARSAQAYAAQPTMQAQQPQQNAVYGVPQPQPPQQISSPPAQIPGGQNFQQQPAPQLSSPPPTNFAAPTPNNTPATGGYAARSQQAYANAGTINSPPRMQQTGGPPQPPPQQPPPPPPQQQQQPTRPFASPGPTPPHAPTASATPMSSQQQQPPQQQQQPPQSTPGGGYAARSAQAHMAMGGTTPQPQQQQLQQQPPAVPSTVNLPQGAGNGFSNQSVVSAATSATAGFGGPASVAGPHQQQIQQRLLTDATRKVQEHAYYMRQAMDQNNLPAVLERAAYMAGELGVPPHGHNPNSNNPQAAPSLSNTGISIKLNPKNYYELYMRALEDMPSFEDYLLQLSSAQPQQQPPQAEPQPGGYFGATQLPTPAKPQPSYTMRELYDCVQYCPRVLSRLYLQISAGSALIRSNEAGPKWVMNDLIQCVKCEQNPIRGLFLRNYLLTVMRDKLPDTPAETPKEAAGDGEEKEQTADNEKADEDILAPGNVVDSYEFVMENFMEMNKLWVRLQHLPGDGNSKEVKKRRERERNDLRILVGTNLVRISQLESVTSQIYGEKILQRILEHVVVVGDPLSQAYLMDCLVQVFPDEYHIETLPILLNVCPRLRDKVNIRTILQGLMDRLSNYLADEELLDESDTNQVKLTLARDSYSMFEECVQKVYNARGPKLTSKEVIRLQTALLQYSLKCYPGNMEQISRCMAACVEALQQANASYEVNDSNSNNNVGAQQLQLDDVSVMELEKLLSIPLESLALRVLELPAYSELIGKFLPWANRRAVAKSMLEAVDKADAPPQTLAEIQQLFAVIQPLTQSEPTLQHPSATTAHAATLMANLGVSDAPATSSALTFGGSTTMEVMTTELEEECALVSKLVHLLDHENTDVVFEMLGIAREQIRLGSATRGSRVLVAVVFASLKLVRRIYAVDHPEVVDNKDDETAQNENDNPANEDPEKETPPDDSKEESKDDEPPTEKQDSEKTTPETTPDQGQKDGEEEATPDKEQKESEPLVSDEATPDKEQKEGDPEVAGPDNAAVATETPEAAPPAAEVPPGKVGTRQVFLFIEETILLLAKANSEMAAKLLLEVALTADSFATTTDIPADAAMYGPVAYELLSKAFSLYEEGITDSKAQRRTVTALIGMLLLCKSLSESDYQSLISKTAVFSAKLLNKSDQCQMVAQCAHLFYPVDGGSSFRNPQRALECLQRSLKLADQCTSSNPSQVFLFVDLLEHYVFFLERGNPSVTANYVTGLAALIKEFLRNATDARAVADARNHFLALAKDILRKKSGGGADDGEGTNEATAALFAGVEIDTAGL